MAKESQPKLYCPSFLKPQAAVIAADVAVGMLGLRQGEIEPWPHDQAIRSIQYFMYRISPFVDEQVRSFAKKDATPPEGEFVLSPLIGWGVQHPSSDSSGKTFQFNMDGDFGFALGFQKKGEPRLELAIGSFILGMDKSYLYLPIIRQLQAGYYGKMNGASNPRVEKAYEVMKTIHWERALVAFMTQWARSVHAPAIGIDPEGPIIYRNQGFSKEKAFMRLEVTARRCGFRPREEDGLYMLQLSD